MYESVCKYLAQSAISTATARVLYADRTDGESSRHSDSKGREPNRHAFHFTGGGEQSAVCAFGVTQTIQISRGDEKWRLSSGLIIGYCITIINKGYLVRSVFCYFGEQRDDSVN